MAGEGMKVSRAWRRLEMSEEQVLDEEKGKK